MSNLSPALHDSPRLRDLVRGLTFGLIAGVRENRLAATLAVFAGILGAFLAVTIRYDERPRFRQVHLPAIQRVEAGFMDVMRAAEEAPNETWRLFYFLHAHLKIRDVRRRIQDQRPATAQGRAAHAELVRYYTLVDEEMSIIRTQMSVDDTLDFWGEWKREQARLEPVRARWLNWIDGD